MIIFQSALLISVALFSIPLGRWIGSMTENEVQAWKQQISMVEHALLAILLTSMLSTMVLPMPWWQGLAMTAAGIASVGFFFSAKQQEWLAMGCVALAILATAGTPVQGWIASIGFLVGLLAGSLWAIR